MLTELCLNGFLAFAVAYPLCFWANAGAAIDQGFYRFNLGISCFILSLGFLASLLLSPLEPLNILLLSIWLTALLGITWFQWKQQYLRVIYVSLPSIFGVFVTGLIVTSRYAYQSEIINSLISVSPYWMIILTLFGGVTLGLALYTMVLGHWYLNVSKLPISILSRAVYIYSLLLCIRLGWDAVQFATQSIQIQGQPLPLYLFISPTYWRIETLDGLLVAVAVFFGSLFPLLASLLVQSTLRAKSTQAATGILYVVVVAAIIGDFSYRFFLLRYGAML